MREEDPLQHLAVVIRLLLYIKRELLLLVVVLRKVQQDRSRLKDIEVVARAVRDRRDTAVRVLVRDQYSSGVVGSACAPT